MKVLTQILKESKTNKNFIGIRTYGSEEEFWCGFVLDYNHSFIQIQHYTEFGEPDGIVIESIDNIEGIDSNYTYAKAIEFLYSLNFKNIKPEDAITISNLESWKFEILCKFIGKADVLALKHEDENTFYGKIYDVDKEFMKIETIGSIGEFEGFYTMRIREVLSIHINSVESNKRKTLSKREKSVGNK